MPSGVRQILHRFLMRVRNRFQRYRLPAVTHANQDAPDVHPTVMPDPAALERVAQALSASQNPALIAGAQIEEDQGWNEAVALAEHLQADVYQQPLPPRWTFPRTHPLFRGGLLPAQQPLAKQLAGYDTVVVLGAPVFLYYAYVPGAPIKPGTKLFQITNCPQDGAAVLVGTTIVGNVASAAAYLRAHTNPRKGNDSSPRREPLQPSADQFMNRLTMKRAKQWTRLISFDRLEVRKATTGILTGLVIARSPLAIVAPMAMG